ncbi:MAG: hypothetical protein FWF24_01070 [Alphaproteobacteria bacterium]|nr:hypothetical protein [Alphaproteobacteria bacterium]
MLILVQRQRLMIVVVLRKKLKTLFCIRRIFLLRPHARMGRKIVRMGKSRILQK